jgi:hypothetical protein
MFDDSCFLAQFKRREPMQPIWPPQPLYHFFIGTETMFKPASPQNQNDVGFCGELTRDAENVRESALGSVETSPTQFRIRQATDRICRTDCQSVKICPS